MAKSRQGCRYLVFRSCRRAGGGGQNPIIIMYTLVRTLCDVEGCNIMNTAVGPEVGPVTGDDWQRPRQRTMERNLLVSQRCIFLVV